jgi:AcrR family transcriptional regulator
MRSGLTTNTVILCAADLSDELGFDSLSISAVARRLGVAAPSLYSHVRDLPALRAGVSALALEELSDAISTQIAGRSGREALFGFAEAHRVYASRSPGRWQSLQHLTAGGMAGSAAVGRLVALTESVLHRYALRPEWQVHATRMLGSFINGFIALAGSGSFSHRSPGPESSWDIAIDAMHTLFSSWPSIDGPDPARKLH